MKQIAVTRVRREDVSSGIAVRRAPPGCVCVGVSVRRAGCGCWRLWRLHVLRSMYFRSTYVLYMSGQVRFQNGLSLITGRGQ